jgi:hypothetical protein
VVDGRAWDWDRGLSLSLSLHLLRKFFYGLHAFDTPSACFMMTTIRVMTRLQLSLHGAFVYYISNRPYIEDRHV